MRAAISLDRAGTVIASATQDVEPILKRNQRLRADPQTSDWGRHVATIPNVILLKWLNEEHARLILTELERVERQVAALLRFARREEFRFEPVDVGELIRGTVDTFRARLEAAGITVELDMERGIVARADAEKLRQVLVNLIENAIDALTDGTPIKRLRVAASAVDGRADIRVSDTGPGVPSEALPHLFDPFFSLKPAGTGLGLAIAKRTIDAHGGRIEVASPSGTGVAFHIALPLARAA